MAVRPMELVESSVVEPEGLKVSMVGAVELSSQEKLRQHVLRGHYPFDPHCLECQQGRGVSRAPRRSLRERILEVQVDFFFLGLVESKFKMILLQSGVFRFAWCHCGERECSGDRPAFASDLS